MKRLLTLYVIGCILTFGHSWHRMPEHVRMEGALGCSLGWPLYWATLAFERKEKP